MTRAIIFDVGNVLLRWEPALLVRDLLGSDEAVAPFLAEIGFAEWNLAQDAGRGWDEAVAELSARHPQHAAEIAAFHHRWHEMLPGPVEGMPEMLDALRAHGWPLLAITNFSAEKWHETRARFPFLSSHFADAVVSGIERVVKPDPAIWHLCLSRNGLAPEEAIFIDDSAANVDAAQALGIDAIRFEDADQVADALAERGIAT